MQTIGKTKQNQDKYLSLRLVDFIPKLFKLLSDDDMEILGQRVIVYRQKRVVAKNGARNGKKMASRG